VDLWKVAVKAKDTALRGGLSGAGAMIINGNSYFLLGIFSGRKSSIPCCLWTVGALMWMRTTVNFQYKYGMGTVEALKHIYNDGGRGFSGVRRFYKGMIPALGTKSSTRTLIHLSSIF
jgi:hypothetical protein